MDGRTDGQTEMNEIIIATANKNTKEYITFHIRYNGSHVINLVNVII